MSTQRRATRAAAARPAAAARSSRPRTEGTGGGAGDARSGRARFRRARPTDVPCLLKFMRALYAHDGLVFRPRAARAAVNGDRKSTRLNSSHLGISYAV